jgi:hypothetical protein
MGGASNMRGEERNAYRVLVGKPEEHNYENVDIGGRIILRWISEK